MLDRLGVVSLIIEVPVDPTPMLDRPGVVSRARGRKAYHMRQLGRVPLFGLNMHFLDVRAAAIEPGSEPAQRNFSQHFLLPARDRVGKPLGLTSAPDPGG